MKIKYVILVLFTIVLCSNKPNGSSLIYWHERNILTWDDFKVVKKVPYGGDALVQTGMPMEMFYENGTLEISIKTTMNPKKSYVKKGSKTDYLLNHEQLHFNIQEIVVRRFRKEVTNHNYSFKNLQKDINRITNKYNKMASELQKKYDKETDHSRKEAQQKKWDAYVAKELKSLEKYSEPEIKITGIK